MYPFAIPVVKEILTALVDTPGAFTEQTISRENCCGFVIQENKDDPKGDIACCIFPGEEQLEKLEEISQMVGSRTLIIFNRQFKRPEDFGVLTRNWRRKQSLDVIFNVYSWGYAFQELAVRGEDVKLTFDSTEWSSVALPDGKSELPLLPPSPDRPPYSELEATINELLPEPLWQRMMQKAASEGPKILRK